MNKKLPTTKLELRHLPLDSADIDELMEFAYTFDGYERWGSFDQCAMVANKRDHSTIDKLRTCLFFENRRWRHFGEDPDDEAILYWKSLITAIGERLQRLDTCSHQWLTDAIRHLPSDKPVAPNTPGYGGYFTHKAHWLGWLSPEARTRVPPRKTGANVSAKTLYNRISEPSMLRWLATASGVDQGLLDATKEIGKLGAPSSSQCAAFRKVIPWRTVAEALDLKVQTRLSEVSR